MLNNCFTNDLDLYEIGLILSKQSNHARKATLTETQGAFKYDKRDILRLVFNCGG